jgi:hypothetical protein
MLRTAASRTFGIKWLCPGGIHSLQLLLKWNRDISLAHFGHVESLTTLIIRGCRQVTDSGMDRLASLTALQHFDARHCKEVRSVRAEWCDMRVLLLTGTAFTETEALIVKDMDRMVELDLRACKVLKR